MSLYKEKNNPLTREHVNGGIINYKLKGFSLMELMIVVAIIGLMTGIGLVSLSGSKTTRALENASREVAAAIREAQNNALTGRQPDSTQTSCGHGFYFDPTINKTRYFIYDDYYIPDTNPATLPNSCSEVNTPPSPKYVAGSSNKTSEYTLKDGVEFTDAAVVDFYFAMPHAVAYNGGVIFDPKDPDPTKRYVRITLEKNLKKNYICVYPDGNVIENGSLATCP